MTIFNPLKTKINKFQRKTGDALFEAKKHKMYMMCTSCLDETIQFNYDEILATIPKQSKLAISNVLFNRYKRKNDWTLVYGLLHIDDDGEECVESELANYYGMDWDTMSLKVTERIKDMVPEKSDTAIGNFWFYVPSTDLDENSLMNDVREVLVSVDAWGNLLRNDVDFKDLKVKHDNFRLRNCLMMG